MKPKATLTIRNFAQIAKADIEFGDLTVLVGPQGTGKSLILQWLKAALDGKQMVSLLSSAGQTANRTTAIIDLIFGFGMGGAWRPSTKVFLDGEPILPREIGTLGKEYERLFYIPAHRSMLISDGWALPFNKLPVEIPIVARNFSQNLYDLFTDKESYTLFPVDQVLKKEYRLLIDAAIYHGGAVGIEQDQHYAKRLRLTHGDTALPFMTWTSGQREFTPLLLGLYHLLPPRKQKKQPEIDWVVIEEPEMGLHPQAITAFLLLVMDLLWRGYKVALSTHSPHLLTCIWMLRLLHQHKAPPQAVCKAFGVQESAPLLDVADSVLAKSHRVYALDYTPSGKVRSTDISILDPGAEDEQISGWGGLTSYSSRFGEVVREAVNR
jgi:energy-coupling factor transporter ATP-binding protein EcfA2